MADSDASVKSIGADELRDVPLDAEPPAAGAAEAAAAAPPPHAPPADVTAAPRHSAHGSTPSDVSDASAGRDKSPPPNLGAAVRAASPRSSIASDAPDARRARSASLRRTNHSAVALEHSSVNGAESRPAIVFIQKAFERIRQSKDAKRIPALQQATARALEEFERHPNALPPARLVLEPLRLVSVPPGTSSELKEVAIDTLGQLFSLSYLADTDAATEEALLKDAVAVVCDAWDAEGAEQRVELQIIKALTAAVVNEDVVVHGTVLLRAVRRMYNIFLVTRSNSNQALAQASLTQMVQAVFERVKRGVMAAPLPANGNASKESQAGQNGASAPQNGTATEGATTEGTATDSAATDSAATEGTATEGAATEGTATEGATTEGVTTESTPNEGSEDADGTHLTLSDMKDPAALPEMDAEADRSEAMRSELEKAPQDAGYVFRTLCRLSVKQDVNEQDVRSQPMRSKLLSLHLVHVILKHHISVFKDPRVVVTLKNENVGFAHAMKPYLRLTMAQNALSQAPAVFEITAEIFWLVLANLRSEFKPELAVLFTEVYFTAMEMPGATLHQRMYFMTVLSRICTDPRLLVELYLNYDCDPAAPDVYEKLMNLISRLAMRPVVEPAQPPARLSIDRQQIRVYDLNASPTQAIARLSVSQPAANADVQVYQLTMAALEAIVNSLRSLVLWSQRSDSQLQQSEHKRQISASASTDSRLGAGTLSTGINGHRPTSSQVSLASSESDDPSQFAERKQTKRALDAAVHEFANNPRRGLQKFVEIGILSSVDDPEAVGRTLFQVDGLDKTVLGLYLGHKDREATLQAFVDAMDFRNKSFIAALRETMQQFRMPGEGQVVDRMMKAFAYKYYNDTKVGDVHPDFAKWEIAWVLASSAMILNTDQHTPALRRRMSEEDYVSYNKGMNDGVDFRRETLVQIYNEIRLDEIKVESEQTHQAIQSTAYDVASDAITSRAAKFFQQSQPVEFTDYYNASHAEHIRPMFEQCWLAVLAGILNPFNLMKEPAVLTLCLEGLELALRIAAHFDVALARQSFVQNLAKNTSLTNLANCTWKNIGAVRALLRVALVEGDMMQDSWYDVLVIASKLDQALLAARSRDASVQMPTDIARMLQSREIQRELDLIFDRTQNMTPEGAVSFVQGLARVSLEEIDESRDLPEPRVFALQKMADICYYNSSRIRMGWSDLWDAAMAEQFTKVLVDPNQKVVSIALNSLRQLSMRFLEIDELPHFAFQSEFLKPFVHALKHNKSPAIQELVLESLRQMVLTSAPNLKSGWKTIFGAVEAAANSESSVLGAAYSLLVSVPLVPDVPPGFLDACVALAVQPEVRTALHAAELMHGLFESHANDMELWQQLFVKFSDIAMQGTDLEVRSRSLAIVFDVLSKHGSGFQRTDWDRVFEGSLSPLFSVLHSQAKPQPAQTQPHQLSVPEESDIAEGDSVSSRATSPVRARVVVASGREERSLYLSSTLIQALKYLIKLFGEYFDMLEHKLEPFFLQLLRRCILQENDPVSRSGKSCLEQLVKDNAKRFTPQHWHLVTDVFVQLFQDTTATMLMDRELLKDPEPNLRQVFQSTVAKTVQMLLVIESARDLLVNDKDVFEHIPIKEILRITTRLLMSYSFARDFNIDQALRHELYEKGVVSRLPNLLIQESLAARIYISVGMRLFRSAGRFSEDPSARQDLSDELMKVSGRILDDYNQLTQNDQRYINKLLPILESVLRHVSQFDDSDFRQLIPSIYLRVIDILNKDMPRQLREEVQSILRRVADVWIQPLQNGEAARADAASDAASGARSRD